VGGRWGRGAVQITFSTRFTNMIFWRVCAGECESRRKEFKNQQGEVGDFVVSNVDKSWGFCLGVWWVDGREGHYNKDFQLEIPNFFACVCRGV
jgi:hypothetical protein